MIRIGGPKPGEPLPPKEKLPMPEEYEQSIISLAEEQLPLIKESLQALVEKILQEKPDMLVFMDKGARIFGTPIISFLKDLRINKLPKLAFFNDDDYKREYLQGDLEKVFFRKLSFAPDKELENFKNKKIFFIDETFSTGKGAVVIKNIKDRLNSDNIYYFALSRDYHGGFEHEIGKGQNLPAKYLDEYNEMMADENFTIFENNINILFSKKAGELYLDDRWDGEKTTTKHAKTLWGDSSILEPFDEESDKNSVPSAYEYDSLYEFPVSREEYYKAIDKKNYKTISMLKQMIYKNLKKGRR